MSMHVNSMGAWVQEDCHIPYHFLNYSDVSACTLVQNNQPCYWDLLRQNNIDCLYLLTGIICYSCHSKNNA